MLLLGGVHEIGRQALFPKLMARAVENPGPKGIEALDPGEIDDEVVPVGLTGNFGRQGFDRARVLGGPGTSQKGCDLVTGALDSHLRLLSQGALRHDGPFGIDSVW